MGEHLRAGLNENPACNQDVIEEELLMRFSRLLCASALLVTPSLAPLAHAESKNPADYPLRVHVFRRSETTFYTHRQTDEAKGEGRANLFENGEPKGIDFQFECPEKMETSSGYETYPARWKKPNEELVVLLPEFGKPNKYFTCDFKIQKKDFAYYSHNGTLSTEPTANFKSWMAKHDYDPEHGKDVPTPSGPSPDAPPPAAAAKPVDPLAPQPTPPAPQR